MILDNHLDVPADPDAVFAVINDVERVAACLPGATLDGREDDTYLGRVTFKVGPISAAYAGRVRFTEVAPEQRRIRLSARGSDSHGNGDAEADVTLTVTPAPGGSALDLHTDLVVRGRIAQFGRGAITAVSTRLLDRFARNLVTQLADASATAPDDRAPAPGPTTTGLVSPPDAPAPAGGERRDGPATVLPPNAGRHVAVAGALAVAFLQGWLLGRIRTQDRLIEELRRDR